MRGPSVLITLGLGATAVAAPRVHPPAVIEQQVAPLGCTALRWTAWSGGWWADCARRATTPLDGELTTHRFLVFHRGADGAFAMEDLVDTHDSSSPRIKIPLYEQVRLRGSRATYEAHTDFGYRHRRVWELSTRPASLLEDREGGDQLCKDGLSNVSSDVVGPMCVTDLAQRRQTCTVERADCGAVRLAPVRYTAIPLHDAAAPLRDPELSHCATTIGARPDDVVSGKSHATFQVVAVDDARTLALHLRATDATPQPITGDDWQVHDHWTLWLANQGDDLACDDTAALAAYCTQRTSRLQVVEVIVAATVDGGWKLFSTAPPAVWSREIHARTSGVDLIVELGGTMRAWARDGSLTIGYSDSTTGTRQDGLLATSPVRPRHADTLGRLGTTLLCDRDRAKP